MKLLHQLTQSLSLQEVGVVRNYLHCFSGHDRPEATLTEQLFNYLLRQKDTPSENDSCSVVYGTFRNKEDVFEKLKQRLKNKILEAISMDVNSEKKVYLEEIDTASLRVKKKSAQLRLLFYSKSSLDITISLLDEIIANCKKYELYHNLSEHLKFKLWRYAFKEGEKKFKEECAKVEFYEDCNKAVYQANNYHYQLIFMAEHAAKYDLEQVQKFLKTAIAELSALYKNTKSKTVNYYLKYLEVNYFMNCGDYIQARRICLDLVKLVRSEPAVKRKQRIGIAYDYFSRCEYYLGEYEKAAEYSRSAQEYFLPASHNLSVSLEQEFYALFAMKKYKISIEVANKMLANADRKELGDFRFAKYNYLRANALFMQHKFAEVIQHLEQEKTLSKDKSGWEIGARLLKIMALIEMIKLDEAGLAVLSLREFIKYTNKKTPVSQRDKTILNLLLILERAGFMFSTLNGSTQKHLVALGSSDEKIRWEPFTHEVIPFHEWFKGKMRSGSGAKDAGKSKIPARVLPDPTKRSKEKVPTN